MLQGVVRGLAGPKSEAEVFELCFINRLQQHDDGPLHHLVFDGGDADGPCARAIPFRDVHAAHGRGLVASAFETLQQVGEVPVKVPGVLRRALPINSCGSVLTCPTPGFQKPRSIKVVVQRTERLAGHGPGQLRYPLLFG